MLVPNTLLALLANNPLIDAIHNLVNLPLKLKILLPRQIAQLHVNIGRLSTGQRTDPNPENISLNMINKHHTLLIEYPHHKRLQQTNRFGSDPHHTILCQPQKGFYFILDGLLLCQLFAKELVRQLVLQI